MALSDYIHGTTHITIPRAFEKRPLQITSQLQLTLLCYIEHPNGRANESDAVAHRVHNIF